MDALPNSRPASRRRPFDLVLLVLFALWVAWHFGRLGLMPLDHSVAFDGGWRILSGQVPWRDFDAPSFVTPSYLQAACFALLGVSWKSALVHAALANAAFAVATRSLACRLGSGRLAAGLLGGAAALLFYPPVGLPFADQHSFLFTLLALLAAVVGRGLGRATEAGRRDGLVAWALVVPLLALAFFSKQLPASLGPLLVAAVLLTPSARPRRCGLLGLAAGLVLSLVAGVLFLVTTGVELDHVRYCLFELPLAQAEVRRAYMPEGLALVGRVLGAGAALGALKTAWLAHLAFLAGGWLALARRRAGDERWVLAGSALLLGEGLLLVGQVTMVLANNQDAAGVAFVVPGVGLLAAGWIRLARSPEVADQALPRSAAAVGATLVLVLALAEPLHWWSDLTHRSTNDMDFDPARAELVSAERSPALAGLWYQPPTHKGYPLEDLLAAAELMAAREGDFLLIGDAALLYGLAGKRSTLPSLWFHPGVTIPLAGTPEFVAWQQRLVDEVEAGTIDRVLEERAGTWIRGWTLADLPRVQAAVVARGYEEQGLGAFRVLELSPR